jgi:hypothetical protein
VHLKKSGLSEHTGNLFQDYAKIKDHLIDDKFILEFLSLDIFPTPVEVTITDDKASFGSKLAALRSQLSEGQASEGSWALRLW